MKIQALRSDLIDALGIVGRIPPTNSTMPIIGNFLMLAEGDALRIAATDLERAGTVTLDARIEEAGRACIPARTFSDTIRALPDAALTIETNDRHGIRVSCEGSHARIAGHDPADYPVIPTVADDAETLTIPGPVLKRAIRRVAFAAATDDNRPVLAGVLIELRGDALTLAAADGFRMAVQTVMLETPSDALWAAIIPATVLSGIQSHLGEESVQIRRSGHSQAIVMRWGRVEMVSQLIAGTFPNYAQLIPARYEVQTTLDVDGVKAAVKLATIYAANSNGIIRLQAEPLELFVGATGSVDGELVIHSHADETGESESKQPVSIEGGNLKIALNNKYLAEVLDAFDKKVLLQTVGPSAPAVFRPVEEDDYTHVAMPMFVQWDQPRPLEPDDGDDSELEESAE